MITQAFDLEFRRHLARELKKELARRSLLHFTRYTFPDYNPHWYHELICKVLDQFVEGDITRLIISMPPQHGKTEHASRRLPAYALGRYPDTKVMACSYNATLATTLNRDVQRIMESDAYRELFPGSRLPSKRIRSSTKGTMLKNSETFELLNAKGSYFCQGVGGGISGRGFHLGIIDDAIKGAQEAYSTVYRNRVHEWYKSEFRTRLNKWRKSAEDKTQREARLLMMMTRWHPDDLIGRVLDIADKDGEADQWYVLNLPAIKEAHGHPEDPRKPGEALWPSFRNEKELRVIERSSANTFAALYQGDPKRAIVAEWPPECFGTHIWFDKWPKLDNVRVCSLDPSKGKGDKYSDYSALCKIGRGLEDGRIYIECDMFNNRDTTVLTTDIVAANDLFAPTGFALESNMFQDLFADLVVQYCAENRYGRPPIYKVNHSVQKETRIRRLAPYVTQDMLRIKDTNGGRILVKQLEEFPLSDHDDGPDALEMGISLYNDLCGGTIDDGLGGNLLSAIGAG